MQLALYNPFRGGLMGRVMDELSLLMKVPIDRGIRFQGILDDMLAQKAALFTFSREPDHRVYTKLFVMDFPKKIHEFSVVFPGLVPYKERYKREIMPHLMWIESSRALRGEGLSDLADHILACDDLIKEHPGLLLDVLKGVVDTTIARRDEVLSLEPGERPKKGTEKGSEKGEMHFFSVSLPEIILLLSEVEDMFSGYPKKYNDKILRHIRRAARKKSKRKKGSAVRAHS